MHQRIVVGCVALMKADQFTRKLVNAGDIVATNHILVQRLQRKFTRAAAGRFYRGGFARASAGQLLRCWRGGRFEGVWCFA